MILAVFMVGFVVTVAWSIMATVVEFGGANRQEIAYIMQVGATVMVMALAGHAVFMLAL